MERDIAGLQFSRITSAGVRIRVFRAAEGERCGTCGRQATVAVEVLGAPDRFRCGLHGADVLRLARS